MNSSQNAFYTKFIKDLIPSVSGPSREFKAPLLRPPFPLGLDEEPGPLSAT